MSNYFKVKIVEHHEMVQISSSWNGRDSDDLHGHDEPMKVDRKTGWRIELYPCVVRIGKDAAYAFKDGVKPSHSLVLREEGIAGDSFFVQVKDDNSFAYSDDYTLSFNGKKFEIPSNDDFSFVEDKIKSMLNI